MICACHAQSKHNIEFNAYAVILKTHSATLRAENEYSVLSSNFLRRKQMKGLLLLWSVEALCKFVASLF